MAVYNQASINYEFIKVRWQEPFLSAGLNRKAFGVTPRGIYSGFKISPLGSRTVTIGPGYVSGDFSTGVSGGGYVSGTYDPAADWSVALHASDDGYAATVAIEPGPNESLTLDCTGQNGNRVYAVLDVVYGLSSATSGSVKLVNSTEINSSPDLIVIGYIDVPALSGTAISSGDIGYDDSSYPRTRPISTSTKPGLMGNSAWTHIDTKLPKSGGTMTGPLTLAADPVSALQASTKQYTDLHLPKTGGTMTGNLTFASGSGDVTSGGLVAGKLIAVRTFTSAVSGVTYTPTTGTRMIEIEMCGGGGGSAGYPATTTNAALGGHGGSGASAWGLIDATGAVSGIYTIGHGGAAGASAASGTAGGTTSFTFGTAYVSCPGGNGGPTTVAALSVSSAAATSTSDPSVSGTALLFSYVRRGRGQEMFGIVGSGGGAVAAFTGLNLLPNAVGLKYDGMRPATDATGSTGADTRIVLAGTALVASSNKFVATAGAGGPGKGATGSAAGTGTSGQAGAIFIREYA